MKALVLSRLDAPTGEQHGHQLQLTDVPDPVPGPGEALIKVRMAGICRTDQELVKGYMNFEGIPGHEFVGEVLEVDNSVQGGGEELPGKRVVGEINCGCGDCPWCNAGLQNHCPDRTVLGISGRPGAFAEYLILPAGNLHPVPDDVNDRSAVFTEPLAVIARAFQIYGCEPVCVGGDESKLEILRSWGLEAVHHRNYVSSPSEIVVEASGSAEGFATALASLKPRGTLVLKSTYHGSLTLDAAPLVVDEITVVGSRCGPFPPALELLKENKIAVQQLITEIYSFQQIEDAFERASKSDALKVLVAFPR